MPVTSYLPISNMDIYCLRSFLTYNQVNTAEKEVSFQSRRKQRFPGPRDRAGPSGTSSNLSLHMQPNSQMKCFLLSNYLEIHAINGNIKTGEILLNLFS